MQATILQRRAQELRASLEGQLTSGWRTFEDVVAVLVAAGALAPTTLEVCDPIAPLLSVSRHTQAFAKALGALAHRQVHPCLPAYMTLQDAGMLCTQMRHAVDQLEAAWPDLLHSPSRTCSAQAQPLGEVARQVNGENELWLAIALTSAAAQVLPC